MSKRRPPIHRPVERASVVSRTAVPAAVEHARAVLERVWGGSVSLDLGGNTYQRWDQFELDGQQIESGGINGARSRANERQIRQFFAFGVYLGSIGVLHMHRAERETGKLLPVSVTTKSHSTDGYMVHLPTRALRAPANDLRFKGGGSFTTGTKLLKAGEPSVSFIAADPAKRAADRLMATATEAMQNRCIASSLSVGGKRIDDPDSMHPFQESLANGAGNMLGAVSLGWTYRQYNEFLSGPYSRVPLWASHARIGLRNVELIAPHIQFEESVYDQLALGQLPDAPPLIISRIPTLSRTPGSSAVVIG